MKAKTKLTLSELQLIFYSSPWTYKYNCSRKKEYFCTIFFHIK